MGIRKDSKMFLKKLLEHSKEIGKYSFVIKYNYFDEIPCIETAVNDILKDLIENNCLTSQSKIIDLEGNISINITQDGLLYFEEEGLKEAKAQYSFNVSGGQVNIANDSGYVSACNENIIYDKSIENQKRQDIDQVTNNERKRYLKTNGSKNISIFISYSWNDAEFVNEIDYKLQAYGYKIEIDIRDAEYAQNIKEFMKRIRKTDYSIIVLSDDFLKSENCMREIFEFIKDENFKDRIIPVILQSTKDIWGSSKGIQYTIYWKEKEDKFKEQLKKIDEESKGGYVEELKYISSIKDSIGEIIKVFRDMKMFDGNENGLAENINSYIKKKELNL